MLPYGPGPAAWPSIIQELGTKRECQTRRTISTSRGERQLQEKRNRPVQLVQPVGATIATKEGRGGGLYSHEHCVQNERRSTLQTWTEHKNAWPPGPLFRRPFKSPAPQPPTSLSQAIRTSYGAQFLLSYGLALFGN